MRHSRKRAGQQDAASDCLFGNFLQDSAFRSTDNNEPKPAGSDPFARDVFANPFWRYTAAVGTRVHNYSEVREYLEKQHPDWLRALTPRHINAPANYWSQKVLAVSPVNYVSTPNPALAAVQGQIGSSCAMMCRLTTFRGNSCSGP